jgi:hypothetical protein
MAEIVELSDTDIAHRILRVAFGDFLANYTDSDVKDVAAEVKTLYDNNIDAECEIYLQPFQDEKCSRKGPLWSFLGYINDGCGEYIFGDCGSSNTEVFDHRSSNTEVFEDLWSLVPEKIHSAFTEKQKQCINHAAKVVNGIVTKRINEPSSISSEERKLRSDLIDSIEAYEKQTNATLEESQNEEIIKSMLDTILL